MFVSKLECPKCGTCYESEKLIQLCDCGATLLVRYDLDKVKDAMSKDELKNRPADLWRHQELFPVKDPANIITLGEGMTPLLKSPTASRAKRPWGWR